MPHMVKQLLENNKVWAEKMKADDPEFFTRLSECQNPEYLWIGCADSRVPVNLITGLQIGEIFIHRNIANVVVHTDLNCLSVLQFAIEVLHVKHIIVCGHYGCGGVKAALLKSRNGLVDNWLRHVQDVAIKHETLLENTRPEKRHDRLCELNVIDQVNDVCLTTVVQDCWQRGQEVTVHGWIYSLETGRLKDLRVSTNARGFIARHMKNAIQYLTVEEEDAQQAEKIAAQQSSSDATQKAEIVA